MYDELWTEGKAMYKLEPALAAGGELIDLRAASGRGKRRTRQLHLRNWLPCAALLFAAVGKVQAHSAGALAHSTHVRGDGRFENGIEYPRANVTLATKLLPEDCQQLALGYQNPAEIDVTAWQNRADDGILYVPKAGKCCTG